MTNAFADIDREFFSRKVIGFSMLSSSSDLRFKVMHQDEGHDAVLVIATNDEDLAMEIFKEECARVAALVSENTGACTVVLMDHHEFLKREEYKPSKSDAA